jgi:acyl-CoA thioester hydrolase
MSAPPEPASGRFDGALHRFPVRVYYEDTDAGGVVYHSNYLRWFERARTEVLRLLGIVQSGTDEGIYAVADLSIRYAAPARLDDAVTIETRALEIGAASVRMSQQALRGKQLLAEATIRIGFLGADGRPRRQPAEWRAKFDVFSTKDPA